MSRSLLALALCLTVALALVACDGDGGSSSSSPKPEATETAVAQASAEASETPNGDNGDGQDGTPEATGTPTPQASPTPQAVRPPDDLEEFLAVYEEHQIIQEQCASFDPDEATVDCEEYGLYSIDPLPQDPEAICHVRLVNDEPIAVTCTSQDPLTVIWYVVGEPPDQS